MYAYSRNHIIKKAIESLLLENCHTHVLGAAHKALGNRVTLYNDPLKQGEYLSRLNLSILGLHRTPVTQSSRKQSNLYDDPQKREEYYYA